MTYMATEKTVLIVVLLFFLLFFTGCSTMPPAEEEPVQPVREVPEEPAEEEAEKPEAEEEQPEEAAEVEEEPEAEELPEEISEELSEEVLVDAPEETEEEFVVTEEVFIKTFDEIEATIEELNKIIKAENFEKWKTYLTGEYIETYSGKEKLAEVSDQPIMKRNNIVIRSLKEYFQYVVVPSRSNARLDDLEFIDSDHVRAIMEIRGQRVILYQLEKTEDNWKIGVF